MEFRANQHPNRQNKQGGRGPGGRKGGGRVGVGVSRLEGLGFRVLGLASNFE